MSFPTHTISLTVVDTYNVLSRIVGLFTGRGFNISSITVGEGVTQGVSRITITTSGDARVIYQITMHLNNLVDVLTVEDLTHQAFVQRELALIKVSATITNRGEIVQIASIFKANIVDISPTSLTLEMTGKSDKLDAAIGMLRPFGLLEVARTGTVAMSRDSIQMTTSGTETAG
jgi:acetolactate synthase-1/3 small subunit